MQNSLFPGNSFSVQDHQGSKSKTTVNRQDLNRSQYGAVTHMEGPLLVVAGAGSGKTRTLVYRVTHLLELGILPENLLLLTFTRRHPRKCFGAQVFSWMNPARMLQEVLFMPWQICFCGAMVIISVTRPTLQS